MNAQTPKFILVNHGEAGEPGHIHAEVTLDGAGWSNNWNGPISEHFSLAGIVTPERANAIVAALNGSLDVYPLKQKEEAGA